MTSVRRVMRIRGIRVYGHDWGIVGEQVLASKRFYEPLLDFMLRGSTIARAFADLLERRRNDRIHAIARRVVSFDLLFGPGGLKLSNQVGGADNIFSQAAQ